MKDFDRLFVERVVHCKQGRAICGTDQILQAIDAAWFFMDMVLNDGERLLVEHGLSRAMELDCDNTSSYLLPDLDGQNLTD